MTRTHKLCLLFIYCFLNLSILLVSVEPINADENEVHNDNVNKLNRVVSGLKCRTLTNKNEILKCLNRLSVFKDDFIQSDLGDEYKRQGKYAESAKWYLLSAHQNYVFAQVALGILYTEWKGVKNNHEEALKWYRIAAESGDKYGLYSLGQVYSEGKIVAKDYTEALKWYKLAADKGDKVSQRLVGNYYANGFGATQDYSESEKWYKRAALQGETGAQCLLADLYFTGKGGRVDYTESHRWLNIAASQGEGSARSARDLLEKLMTVEQVAEAQKRAKEYAPIAEK